ncbi:hypothetical protein Tco_0144687 [Tanacetum coccineum]
MMTYLKHVGNFKHAELKIKKFEEVQALYEKIKRSDEDFISIGSAEDERLIKRMNEKGVDSSKDETIKEELTEIGLVIHMLVEKKYPLRKEVLVQMLNLKLEFEEDSTMALELIRFIKKILADVELKNRLMGCEGLSVANHNYNKWSSGFSITFASVVKSWLVHDQTVHALANPKANELTIPEQTATGKGTSNPLMAGSLPKTTKPT